MEKPISEQAIERGPGLAIIFTSGARSHAFYTEALGLVRGSAATLRLCRLPQRRNLLAGRQKLPATLRSMISLAARMMPGLGIILGAAGLRGD
jgi:hypothetical protein